MFNTTAPRTSGLPPPLQWCKWPPQQVESSMSKTTVSLKEVLGLLLPNRFAKNFSLKQEFPFGYRFANLDNLDLPSKFALMSIRH